MARWDPDDWDLGLAVIHEGGPIGMQHIFSRQFAATRGFGSSFWLALPYQGRGFRTEPDAVPHVRL